MQRLVFGRYDGSTSTKTSAFLRGCLDSGIESEISTDIWRAIWEKFVFLVGVSAGMAVMRKLTNCAWFTQLGENSRPVRESDERSSPDR